MQPPAATEDQRYEHSPYIHHQLLQISLAGIGPVFGISNELKKVHFETVGVASDRYLNSTFSKVAVISDSFYFSRLGSFFFEQMTRRN
jgi:hypothetical protein